MFSVAADIDMFCKMTKAHHCAHSLLPPVESSTHYFRPKGHMYELPRCGSEVYKSHLYPVASFGIACTCVLLRICVYIFYFHCHISTAHVRLIPVYLTSINQSINQPTNQSINHFVTARSSYASAVLGIVILSVCLSVRPSHACFVTQ